MYLCIVQLCICFNHFNLTDMKKLLVLALCFMSLSSYAQKAKSGSFELPANEKYITFDWDCSETLFEKKFNETEWCAFKGDDWDKAKTLVIEMLVKDINESMNGSRVVAVLPNSELKASYIIFICPQKLDSKGNNITTYILKDPKGKELGRTEFLGAGGRWGSFTNLIGDGYEDSGKKLGKLMKKYNKTKK